MVHVVQFAVVVFSRRWSQIEKRPAEEFDFGSTGPTASVGTISLEKGKKVTKSVESFNKLDDLR